MKQGIEKIIELVTTTVHPDNAVNLDLTEGGLNTLFKTAVIEIESIRRHLLVSMFDLEKQSDIESLVENYQSLIIRILDDLHNYQVNEAANKNLILLYTSISGLLTDALSYIENYFSKYFDIDQRVPHIYYSSHINEFERHLNELNLQLKQKSVDHELITIINSTYSPTNNDVNQNTITYRHLIYLKELLSELTSLSSDAKRKDLNLAIRNHLVYLNYNSPAFVVYVIDKLSGEVNAEQSEQDKLLKLKLMRKEINQINCRNWKYLHKDIISVKDQLINWIEEEIFFLQDQSNILKQKVITDQKSDQDNKINTSLSIPQLAILIRLLVENKTITNINQTQILKFFALHFTSLKRENISYGHLRSQYYKTELPAIESIKSLLLTLVNLSRKIK